MSPVALGRDAAGRRTAAASPVVAIVSLAFAAVCTQLVGLPIRDPDHVAGGRLATAGLLVVALVGADIVVRAMRRARIVRPSLAALAAVRRERWTSGRVLAVAAAVIAFYVTYLAYRNVKSVVPLLRPGVLFDRQLADVDRTLLGGAQPGELLHGLLGAGVAAHLLSGMYLLLFVFIPGSLAAALVFSSDLRAGLFYATGLGLNWLIGAVGYVLVPALGPVYVEPSLFRGLPPTAVASLQHLLLDERVQLLHAPFAPGAAQGIGAFPSLHVSLVVTGALAAHVLRLHRGLVTLAWVLVAATVVSTIYFGWHYVLDDLAGAAVAVLALASARLLTGSPAATRSPCVTARPAGGGEPHGGSRARPPGAASAPASGDRQGSRA